MCTKYGWNCSTYTQTHINNIYIVIYVPSLVEIAPCVPELYWYIHTHIHPFLLYIYIYNIRFLYIHIFICVPSLVEITSGVPEFCWDIHTHSHTHPFLYIYIDRCLYKWTITATRYTESQRTYLRGMCTHCVQEKVSGRELAPSCSPSLTVPWPYTRSCAASSLRG
jgi:hypothetical protein